MDEACANILPHQILGINILPLHRHLNLELASTEAEVHNRHAACRGIAVLWRGFARYPPGPCNDACASIVLLHLVQTGNAQVDTAFAHKRRDVGSGEEDQRDREVLDEGNVEAVLSPELDVCAFKQVNGSLLQSAL